MKYYVKIPLIIIGAILFLYGGFICYMWLTNSAIRMGNPLYMDYRYRSLFTLPLANHGCAEAQYKMGAYWFYGGIGCVDEDAIPEEELIKAVEWWEKAANSGHEEAIEELAKAKKILFKEREQVRILIREN